MRKIPVTGKVFTDEDQQAMVDCIMSGEEITYGSWNVKFEKMLADYIGVRYAYFVNSGSSANLLALSALMSPQLDNWRLIRGDKVITVAAAFPTTVAPIIQLGLIPVFVDIDPLTYNIKTEDIEQAISCRTKCIFIAHTLGNPFDVNEIKKICQEKNLWLIEDNSDAFGSTYDGKKTGSFGHISTSSFYPAHHLTTGQGGAVFTDNTMLAKILLSLRNWGKNCVCGPNQDNLCGKRFTQQYGDLPLGYDHKYVFSEFGYNMQGTNVLAALGCSQLSRIREFTEQRHSNFADLYTILDEAKLSIQLPTCHRLAVPSWFGFPILLNEGINRNKVVAHLESKGIATRTLFAGNILRQPCFTENHNVIYRQIGDLANTDSIMNRMFWVGCWHGLNADDMMYIGDTLKEAL